MIITVSVTEMFPVNPESIYGTTYDWDGYTRTIGTKVFCPTRRKTELQLNTILQITYECSETDEYFVLTGEKTRLITAEQADWIPLTSYADLQCSKSKKKASQSKY